MKTKPLLMIILNAKCLMFSFIFFLLFNIQHSTFNIACAQPAKVADKLAPEGFNRGSVTTNLPKIIKEINIPGTESIAVDEKENRVFVMSLAGTDSAIIVLDGKNNSIIKKIKAGENFSFSNSAAGNGIAYNPNTNRLYTLTNWDYKYEGEQPIVVVIDTKSYNIKSIIKFYDPNNKDKYCCTSLSINLDKSGNMVYIFPRHYQYILAFNGSSDKFAGKLEHKARVNYAQIDEKGDFIYLVADRFIKFDVKAKKVTASLPIGISSIPFINEENGLIYAASVYKLYIIDLNTFKIKDTREDIPASGGGGYSIVLNPTTNHLFVPTYNDSVSVVDVNIMEIITTIKVGQTVRSIAVNSKTNRVYVTLSEGKVVVIQDR